MIIVGYQGIGKSTLAGKDRKFIDLESSNFFVNGERAEDWYRPYCQIAEHLSQQGYIVFTSSHEVVRKRLESSKEVVVLVYPALQLKNLWLDKLNNRYLENPSEKNYKALMNAMDRYEENIMELMSSNFNYRIELRDCEYDLESEIVYFKNRDLDMTAC